MTKIIKIEICYDCPYYGEVGFTFKFVCKNLKLAGNVEWVIDNLYSIPEWCPLEDESPVLEGRYFTNSPEVRLNG